VLDPATAFSLALAWAGLGLMFGIFVWYMWNLYTEGVLDFGEAVAATLAVLAYMAQVLLRWGTFWGPLLLLLAVVAVPVAFWASKQVVRRGERMLLQEDAVAWERTTFLDPKNAGAYQALGEIYLEAGAYQAAMQALARALELAPNERRTRTMHQKALRLIEQAARRMTRCPACAQPLEENARICPFCMRLAAEKPVEAGRAAKPLPHWLAFALAGVLVLTSAASVGRLVPPWLAALVSIAALGATSLYVYRLTRR